MTTNLKEIRSDLFKDSYAHERNGKVILSFSARKLYKECKIEEVPVKFQESIKKHLEFGGGMGSGLTYENDNYYFSNTSGKSFHKCFKKVNKIPHFECKLKNLMFENVKNFIDKNNLEIICRLKKEIIEDNQGNLHINLYVDDENNLHGGLYVTLDSQKYFEKENSTSVEEMDEYFFWHGKTKKKIRLDFIYKLSKPIENINKKEIEKEVISLFNQEKIEFFSKEWEFM